MPTMSTTFLRMSFSRLIQFHRPFSSSSSPIVSYIHDLSIRDLIADSHPSALLSDHRKALESLPPCLYAGFDPSAASLHVGNLMVLLNLFRSSQFGCRPVAVIGGSTVLVGDPSGRDTDRDAALVKEIQYNKERIREQITGIWRNINGSSTELTILDNSEWLGDMTLVKFLNETRALRIGEMLRTRAIKARLEGNGLSFTEFCYQALQAYDWRMLSEKYGCLFQLGGSDQLGHLDIGAHFIARTTKRWACGVCLPLLTDAEGKKLGKSTGGGGIWIDPEKTSPFHFYQFFRQLHDDQAITVFKRFSLRKMSEVNEIISEHNENLGKWVVQNALADEMTIAIHGEKELRDAQVASRALFYGSMSDVEQLPTRVLLDVFGSPFEASSSTIRTFGDLADLSYTGKGKGREMMKKGSFKVNGEKRIDPAEDILPQAITIRDTTLTLVCWGKRKFYLVKWS